MSNTRSSVFKVNAPYVPEIESGLLRKLYSEEQQGYDMEFLRRWEMEEGVVSDPCFRESQSKDVLQQSLNH